MSAPWAAAIVALWLIVVFVALLVLGILRRVSTALERAEARLRLVSTLSPADGLEPGSALPEFEAQDAGGGVLTSRDFEGVPTVVLFLGVGCPPCEHLALELRRSRDLDLESELLVVVDDTTEGRALGRGLPGRVVYQIAGSVSHAFNTLTSPRAFAIDSSAVVVDAGIPHSVTELELLALRAKEGGDASLATPEKVLT